MTMRIRPWEEKDIDAIAEMEERCFSDPWKKSDLANVVKYPFYQSFLAEEGGQVCGYGCMIVMFETAEVANIAVDIPHRGRGIGERILTAMHTQAKNSTVKNPIAGISSLTSRSCIPHAQNRHSNTHQKSI